MPIVSLSTVTISGFMKCPVNFVDTLIRFTSHAESSLAPPPFRDRSRALSTQKKLEQVIQL